MREFAFAVVAAGPALMLVGIGVIAVSFARRRIGSVIAARLLALGPALTLVGGGFVALQVDIDLPVRILVAAIPLMSGVAICIAALRARLTFRSLP